MNDRKKFFIQHPVLYVDTNRGVEKLTKVPVASTDSLIIPINHQLLAMMGLQGFIKTGSKIRHRINSMILTPA